MFKHTFLNKVGAQFHFMANSYTIDSHFLFGICFFSVNSGIYYLSNSF